MSSPLSAVTFPETVGRAIPPPGGRPCAPALFPGGVVAAPAPVAMPRLRTAATAPPAARARCGRDQRQREPRRGRGSSVPPSPDGLCAVVPVMSSLLLSACNPAICLLTSVRVACVAALHGAWGPGQNRGPPAGRAAAPAVG